MLNVFDRDLFGEPVINRHKSRLAASFDYPPFSVLSARDGWWQDRKREWLALGIKSELGRGAAPGGTAMPGDRTGDATEAWYSSSRSGDARTFGQDLMRGEGLKHAIPGGGTGKNSAYMFRQPDGKYEAGTEAQGPEATGTSIFDPVLTELAYRWFCPPNGLICDPFAGGSVRGIVAAVLGYQYGGFELRAEQVAANRSQAGTICPENPPHWFVGDSRETLPEWQSQADFLFSCPPYGDLEVYSDLPGDISAMEHGAFLEAYRAIIGAAANKLGHDRFAAFVVGDFRCKEGFYRRFVSETIAAFEAAGLRLYNEAILVTAVGSLPVRVGKQFRVSRKLGKTHQNVLVFVKGDPRKAAAACNGEAA